jgi:hypothetical protein
LVLVLNIKNQKQMEPFSEFSSDFKLQGVLVETPAESLQRTEEWFEKRKGRFTGSKMKDLMGCGQSTARKPWTDPAKLYDFGATAEKYIFAVGMERKTGFRSMEIDAQQLRWGRENEDRLVEQLIKDGVITDFEQMSFEQFYENGGASVDGRAKYQGEIVGMELKCTTSWDGYYARMYEKVHEKHNDFWQHQAEMASIKVPKLLYVVAMPMQIERYEIQIVNESKLHQHVMRERCKIADEAIALWGGEHSYSECLALACAKHQEVNQNQI